MREFSMTTYEVKDIKKVRATGCYGDSIAIVIQKDHGSFDDYLDQTRYILSPKQAKALYKSLKKAMYR